MAKNWPYKQYSLRHMKLRIVNRVPANYAHEAGLCIVPLRDKNIDITYQDLVNY